MAEARDKVEWRRTAWLCQFIHNCNLWDEHSKSVSDDECNPYLITAKERANRLAKALNKQKKPLLDKFNASKALAYYQRIYGGR